MLHYAFQTAGFEPGCITAVEKGRKSLIEAYRASAPRSRVALGAGEKRMEQNQGRYESMNEADGPRICLAFEGSTTRQILGMRDCIL